MSLWWDSEVACHCDGIVEGEGVCQCEGIVRWCVTVV